MPLYEYECDACGHRFEMIRKFSDPPIEVCPKCGGHVRKLISAGAFQLKGSGWYATDYAKKDNGSKLSGSKDKDKDAPAGEKDSKGSKDSKDSGAKSDTSASGSASSSSGEGSSSTTAKPSSDSKD